MKIAIYSCNFGNYRKELTNIDIIKVDSRIDYYFFTDNTTIQSKKWKIVNTLLIPADHIIDMKRWTAKNVKFILPSILKDYDYVIWIDSKPKLLSLVITYNSVIDLIKKNPDIDVFNLSHPERKTAQEELKVTISRGFENVEPANKFLELIKDFKCDFTLPETCIFVRNTKEHTHEAFLSCYNLMKLHKLKRDQNIYNYAISKTSIKLLLLDDLEVKLSLQ